MEPLKHECGVAMVRLLKPLEYYQEKYGTWMYGLNKLYLMMEKQHNRGQEGAGMACVNLAALPGHEYMFRERAEGSNAITEIFGTVHKKFMDLSEEQLADVDYARHNLPFAGEMYMGHLRYSTTGKSGLTFVHPFLRRNNWRAKNLCLCGNFNMTNVHEIFEKLLAMGQSPRIYSDTYITLELMGHRLDREVERNFIDAQKKGLKGRDITDCIRPAFWYKDDEVIAVASERPVLQTTFGLDCDDIHELEPGQAIVVTKNGVDSLEQIIEQRGDSKCSFERIYFSRGSDRDIYNERKKLGEQLTESILKTVDYDTEHTVFSFIPNTAEVAFYGMLGGFKRYINDQKIERLYNLGHTPTKDELQEILHQYVRSEKVAWKDIKLRTFITEGNTRKDLASHVYDVTYGSIEPYVDNLVIIDDSIVRGTTLKESILKILDSLHPKKIVVVSSSPQIRYPDYYGIDMPSLEEFCVFGATMQLMKERDMLHVVDDIYENCLAELKKPRAAMRNCVRDIYTPFTVNEINQKIIEMLRPEGMTTPVELVFQSIEGLHKAIPGHKGDWYFTGNYPTPGGTELVNRAFVSFYENKYKKRK